MTSIQRALSVALVTAIAACSPAPIPVPPAGSPILGPGSGVMLGSSVEVRIDMGTKLKTQAAKKTIADIHHYHLKLTNASTGAVVAEGDTTDLITFFHKVPNGTYKVVVDALDAAGVSLVQGGAQESSNTVTVASPNVTYSDGVPCLKVKLKLLNATGEKIGNVITVEDGDDWTGAPELSTGGDCPCPSPSPAGDPFFGNPISNGSFGNIVSGPLTIPGTSTQTTPQVSDIAFDAAGNMYFSATHYVWMMPKATGTYFGQQMTANTPYVIAGYGPAGEGELAVQSWIGYVPDGITVSAQGDVFFAAANAVHMIPKSDGVNFGRQMLANHIYTVVGNGDTSPNPANSIPATSAYIRAFDVATDAGGNLYVSDPGNLRIRFVPKDSNSYFGQAMQANYIYTIAGGGSGSVGANGFPGTGSALSAPTHLTLDHNGNVFVADGSSIYFLAKQTGNLFGKSTEPNHLYRVAGGGNLNPGDGAPATDAQLSYPVGISLDNSGNLIFSDYLGARVRMVAGSTGNHFGLQRQANNIYTIVGTGTQGESGTGGLATSTPIRVPYGLATDPQGNLFFTDNFRIRALPR